MMKTGGHLGTIQFSEMVNGHCKEKYLKHKKKIFKKNLNKKSKKNIS